MYLPTPMWTGETDETVQQTLQECHRLMSEIEAAMWSRSVQEPSGIRGQDEDSPAAENVQSAVSKSATPSQLLQAQEPTPPVTPGHVSPHLRHTNLPVMTEEPSSDVSDTTSVGTQQASQSGAEEPCSYSQATTWV